MKYLERFTALLECNSEAEWLDMLLRFGGEHGYEKTLLAVLPDRHTLLEDAFVRSNYPARWRHIYDSTKLANIDPVVSHCITRSTPLIWKPEIFSGRSQQEMYEEACGHGIRAGLTLPFHGANGALGVLCLVNDAPPDKHFRNEALRNIPVLSLLRDFAFEASLKFARTVSPVERIPAVTRRELECLKWSAAGRSSWEIGLILHCSERTVNFHFSNLRRKLNATSRRQAVVKAMRMGLIHAN